MAAAERRQLGAGWALKSRPTAATAVLLLHRHRTAGPPSGPRRPPRPPAGREAGSGPRARGARYSLSHSSSAAAAPGGPSAGSAPDAGPVPAATDVAVAVAMVRPGEPLPPAASANWRAPAADAAGAGPHVTGSGGRGLRGHAHSGPPRAGAVRAAQVPRPPGARPAPRSPGPSPGSQQPPEARGPRCSAGRYTRQKAGRNRSSARFGQGLILSALHSLRLLLYFIRNTLHHPRAIYLLVS